VQFARGADVLIHDAQYREEHYRGQIAGLPSTQGFGHSTVTMACEVATAAQVGTLVLFHHDPAYEDSLIEEIEREAQKRFENTVAAYEGLEIVLTRSDNERMKQCNRNRGVGDGRVKYAQDG
jgi:ribonuclease BN (tRNA processing enzyme)